MNSRTQATCTLKLHVYNSSYEMSTACRNAAGFQFIGDSVGSPVIDAVSEDDMD